MQGVFNRLPRFTLFIFPTAFSVHSVSKQALPGRALQILSGCQHTIISCTITERHNIAWHHENHQQTLLEGSLAGFLVHMDAGSTNRLAQKILQEFEIPEHANNRTIPSWLFDARSSPRDRLTSSRPEAKI